MKVKNIFDKVFFIGSVGVSILALFFIITTVWIGYDVKRQCQEAKWEYGGRCVEALEKLLNDSSRSFRARNNAIWALGQIGDESALPILQSYYTGQIPAKEPLNEVISQYELKKAINLTSGGANITAVFWRNFVTGKSIN